MKKITKFWLIVATLLIFSGSILFTLSMSLIDWDFSKLGTVEYETNSYEINEDFQSISIDTTTTDIIFKKSDDKVKVECLEISKLKHKVEVIEGKLTISYIDSRDPLDNINIFTKTPKITIYLLEKDYVSLEINNTTGDIAIEHSFKFNTIDIELTTGDILLNSITTKTINIEVTTGDVTLKNTIGEALFIKGSTSEIILNNTILSKEIKINNTTGDVMLNECDSPKIYIKTTTGDILGTLLSDKDFTTNSTTGDINVPDSSSNETCELITTTGDIHIRIKQ